MLLVQLTDGTARHANLARLRNMHSRGPIINDGGIDGNRTALGRKKNTWENFSTERFADRARNLYPDDAQPAYIVAIYDHRQEYNLGNFHQLEVAKRIIESGTEIAGVHPSGIKKFLVTFNSIEEAHRFCDFGIKLIDPNWAAFIPDSSVHSIGIIFNVPTSQQSEDLLNGLDHPFKTQVAKFERILKVVRQEDGSVTYIPLLVVKVYFKRALADYLTIWSVFLQVKEFILPVTRCYNCQRFGHGAEVCRPTTESRCNR